MAGHLLRLKAWLLADSGLFCLSMHPVAAAGPEALIASCDEMRDHLFQLLRPKYFLKWKQRHQVYYR